MSLDQPKPIRVVRIPDAEQLACLRFLGKQLDLTAISIAEHKLNRIDMPLKQPP